MVAKLQTCYNDLDAVTEDLSELKATGLVEGFEMPSGSNHGSSSLFRNPLCMKFVLTQGCKMIFPLKWRLLARSVVAGRGKAIYRVQGSTG